MQPRAAPAGRVVESFELVDPGVLVADLTRRRQRKTEIDASVADLARLHAAAGDDSATDLPRPYRPRDLDWAVVNLVATEAPR